VTEMCAERRIHEPSDARLCTPDIREKGKDGWRLTCFGEIGVYDGIDLVRSHTHARRLRHVADNPPKYVHDKWMGRSRALERMEMVVGACCRRENPSSLDSRPLGAVSRRSRGDHVRTAAP
jgi:hypothetical protein